MNKMQLIEELASKTGTTKHLSELVLDATLEVIMKSVGSGESVRIVGFGSFEKVLRQERLGRNPQTGKTVKIPATQLPRFRPGKIFKDSLK